MTERYLIADDDDVFRETLARSLRKRGLDVLEADSIETVKKLLADVETDLQRAVIDLRLGQDNGLELIKAIREHSPHTKIVMVTGYSSIATSVDAMKLGACNYLCKPVGTAEIVAAFDDQPDALPEVPDRPPSVERLEWEHIQRVLADNQGNISATARSLGMHRRTLQRKLQKRPVRQ